MFDTNNNTQPTDPNLNGDPMPQNALPDSLTSLFTTDLTNVELERPIAKPGEARLTIKSMTLVDSKDGADKNIKIELVNKYDLTSTKSKAITAGRLHIQHYVSLKPVDKNGAPRQDRILEDLAKIKVSCGFGKAGAFGNLSNYVGQEVQVLLDIESDERYGDRNIISKFIPKTA